MFHLKLIFFHDRQGEPLPSSWPVHAVCLPDDRQPGLQFKSHFSFCIQWGTALDIRILYTFGDGFYSIPVSALQPRTLKIKVVMLTFNVSPIYTTYCMAVLFTRFMIKHLGFQPNNSCTSMTSWTAPPLCPYFKQTGSEPHSERSQFLSVCGFVNSFSSCPNFYSSSKDW